MAEAFAFKISERLQAAINFEPDTCEIRRHSSFSAIKFSPGFRFFEEITRNFQVLIEVSSRVFNGSVGEKFHTEGNSQGRNEILNIEISYRRSTLFMRNIYDEDINAIPKWNAK